MTKNYSLIVTICFMWITFSSAGAQAREKVNFYDGDFVDLKHRAWEDNQPYFVYFYFNGCTGCNKMKDQTFSSDQLSTYVNSKFLAYKINVQESRQHRGMAQAFKVSGFPMILVFGPDGEKMDQIYGFVDDIQLKQKLMMIHQKIQPTPQYAASVAPPLPEETAPRATESEGLEIIIEPLPASKPSEPAKALPEVTTPEQKDMDDAEDFSVIETAVVKPMEKEEEQEEKANETVITPIVEREVKETEALDTASVEEEEIAAEEASEELAAHLLSAMSNTNAVIPCYSIPGFEKLHPQEANEEKHFAILIGAYGKETMLQAQVKRFKRMWQGELWVFRSALSADRGKPYHLMLGTFKTEEDAGFYAKAIERITPIKPIIKDLKLFQLKD
ncbi:MAG: thioredoxin fold domain-containing protein [Bacteroidota bacterium]